MALFFKRLHLALTLDREFYDGVAADPTTQGHALWVVALFAMAASFGTFSRVGGVVVNISLAVTLISWYVWAFSTYYVATHVFAANETPRDRKMVMRVMGFASAPGILRIFGFIPVLSGLIFLGSSIWMIYAAAKALRRALKYDDMSRALGVTMACFILSMLVQFTLMAMLLQLFAVKANL